MSTQTTNANAYHELLFEGLSSSNIYVAYVYKAYDATKPDNTQNGSLVEIALKAPVSTPPAAISFSPTAGSVAAGTSITLTSSGATTIEYQWGASAIDGDGDWTSAETYSDNNKPVVPAVGSTNTVLSVKATNTYGSTYGSASYTPVKFAYKTIYSFADGIGSQEVSTGNATITTETSMSMSITNTAGRIKLTPAIGYQFKNGDAITFLGSMGNDAKTYGIKYGSTTSLGTDLKVASAGDPCYVSGTLSLASDADNLYIGRYDATTTNITAMSIRRLTEATSEAYSGVKIDGSAATLDTDYTIDGTTITLAAEHTFTALPNVALVNHIVFSDASTEDQSVNVAFGAPDGEYYTGTATIDGTTYTVKAPCGNINALKVVYKSGDTTIKEENLDVTGLKVGASYTVPFRMYVEKDGALYQTTANGSTYYGDAVTLTYNTTVTKTVSLVDLNGGTIELFEDFDGSTKYNADTRASNCSAYDNTEYTSTDDLPAGIYNFIIRAANINDRGSVIKVGDITIWDSKSITKGSWNDIEVNDKLIPVAGKLSLAKTGNAYDDYDIIIAIRTGEAAISTTITPTGYATFSSPYALNFSGTIENLDAAYYASAVAPGSVTMTKLNQAVPAETGLFLKGKAGETVTIPVVASGTDINGDNYLKPNTSESTVTASTENAYHYVFAYTASDNSNPGFFNLGKDVKLGAGKAYLETTTDIKATSQAKVSILFFDDNLTGVKSIDASSNVNAYADKMYNLGGQLVGESYKGIVIVNGKKVIK